jgi:phospholipid/cholesterol/gamma-HCH transport system substrate-binding protein
MREEVRVGAFVLLAATTLLALTLWILGRGVLGGVGPSYVVLLPHAGGVVTGDRVRVAGVEAGRVESVTLHAGATLPVRVEVSLEPSVTLHRGASATLRADSLLSGNYLELDPGLDELPPLEPGDEILGTERVSIDTAFAALTELASTAEETLVQLQSSIATLTGSLEPTIARLQATLSDDNVESLRRLVTESTATVTELRPRLTELLERADSLLAQLETATGDVPELVASARQLTEDLSTALGEDGEQLAAVLQSARSTLDSLHAGEGEVAALLDDLAAAVGNLRSLSESLRERPSTLLGLHAPRDRRPGDPPRPAEGDRTPP